MGIDSRLKKLETIVGTRGGGHPTVVRLELRHQRFVFDSAGSILADSWEPLDPGPPGSPQRAAFDLCCRFDESANLV